MPYSLKYEEQETTIRFDRTSDKVTIYSSDTNVIARLLKYREQNSAEWTLVHRDEYGVTMETKKSLIHIREHSIKRELSDEQKAKIVERFAKAREGKQ